MLLLLSLHIHFPLLFIFHDFLPLLIHVSLFFISLPFVVSVSSGLRNSLISSSHLFFGLPTSLFAWYLVLRPGFHFAAFFVHRSSGSNAILIARRHFILLCASIQHGIWLISSFQWLSLCFFHVFNPFFLFNFNCVNLFIGVFPLSSSCMCEQNAQLIEFTFNLAQGQQARL